MVVVSISGLQYPRTDRRLYNTAVDRAAESLMSAYSILVRIVASATLPGDPRPEETRPLTVSSNGSSPLQQSYVQEYHCACTDLQYPQTDRRLCNVNPDAPTHWLNHLQYPQTDRRLCNNYDACHIAPCEEYLQYPQTDRRLCNSQA